MMKQCSKCKRTLPANLDYFYKRSNRSTPFSSQCKECRKKYYKEYHSRKDTGHDVEFDLTNKKGEIWESVVGFEGSYEISNLGRVKGLSRRVDTIHGRSWYTKERILSTHYLKEGYEIVTLSMNGDDRKYLVHRLVAEAFLGDAGKHMQVNHIDENRQNNKLENLEWVTPKVNVKYRHEGHDDLYIKKCIARLIEVGGLETFKKLSEEVMGGRERNN